MFIWYEEVLKLFSVNGNEFMDLCGEIMKNSAPTVEILTPNIWQRDKNHEYWLNIFYSVFTF